MISPLLANVYLHEVLDLWFHREVLPRLRGRAFLVRYADDFVIAFEGEDDALRVHDVLPKRFARYGLELHPEKTRLLDFRHPRHGGGDPGSFDLLGFTHYWGTSCRGAPVIKRKTMKARLRRALRGTSQWCRAHRHAPIEYEPTPSLRSEPRRAATRAQASAKPVPQRSPSAAHGGFELAPKPKLQRERPALPVGSGLLVAAPARPDERAVRLSAPLGERGLDGEESLPVVVSAHFDRSGAPRLLA